MSDAGNKSAWRDLRVRLLSAIVLVAVAGIGIGAGGLLYQILIIGVMAGMAAEAATLLGVSVKSWRGIVYVLWALGAGLAAATGRWDTFPIFCVTSLVFGAPLCAVMCVIVLSGTALQWLRLGGVMPVLFVVCVVVASDSCAYLTGRLVGGPKLAPRISPGKTRSGAVGGLVGAVLAGSLIAQISGQGGIATAAVWAALLGVAAQTGDLAESAMKRALGVKDSGTLLPGHGGLLDRFDGLVAAAPLAAVASLCVGAGVPFWQAGLHAVFAALAGKLPG
ncbi:MULTISPECIES: phosphatidate cytidylyltransferase [Acetobacter]|uniref:phosphatidate cytidylyltransferase n=1 Tax=Acetobacter TaxID=434 RepID=UPI001EDAEEA3|nr:MULTISPECIES: phosphatidate cytidylyltransferase [Acetobacter]MCC6105131.1 phosphatidate cytidylyltransferase [Acetobacter sp.]MCG4272957.1 phosphatidate cytidylyltransferase [Acetobacter senegalensis]MCP1195736.1 phosphatidate cytidylyltransferase [Acetobacter senegalensis]